MIIGLELINTHSSPAIRCLDDLCLTIPINVTCIHRHMVNVFISPISRCSILVKDQISRTQIPRSGQCRTARVTVLPQVCRCHAVKGIISRFLIAFCHQGRTVGKTGQKPALLTVYVCTVVCQCTLHCSYPKGVIPKNCSPAAYEK